MVAGTVAKVVGEPLRYTVIVGWCCDERLGDVLLGLLEELLGVHGVVVEGRVGKT